MYSRPPFFRTIPAKFDEAFSYEQQILMLVQAIDSIEKELVGIEDSIMAKVDDKLKFYYDNIMYEFNLFKTEIKDEITALEKKLADNIDEINKDVQAFKIAVQDELYRIETTLLKRINELALQIIEVRQYLKDYCDAGDLLNDIKLKQAIEVLEQKISEVSYRMIVKNPTTGQESDINTALEDIYNVLRIFGISAYDYDNLRLTAYDYQRLRLTARNYDFKMELVAIVRKMTLVTSPVTGRITTLQNCLNELAGLHRNCLTVAEWKATGLTVKQIQDLKMTARQFDFDSKSFVTTGG